MNVKSYHEYITPEEYETAAKNGITKGTLESRIRHYDWDREIAVTKPTQDNEKYVTWLPVAESNGIPRRTFYSRIRKGMEPVEAATLEKQVRGGSREKIPKNFFELAEKNGIKRATFLSRYYRWRDPIRAATEPLKKADRHWNDQIFGRIGQRQSDRPV